MLSAFAIQSVLRQAGAKFCRIKFRAAVTSCEGCQLRLFGEVCLEELFEGPSYSHSQPQENCWGNMWFNFVDGLSSARSSSDGIGFGRNEETCWLCRQVARSITLVTIMTIPTIIIIMIIIIIIISSSSSSSRRVPLKGTLLNPSSGSLKRDLIESVYVPKGPLNPDSHFLLLSSRS